MQTSSSDSDGSVTPPSSESSPPLLGPHSEIAIFPQRWHKLFPDLSKYLPLGSYAYRPSNTAVQASPTDAFHELETLPIELASHAVSISLQSLLEWHWVRVFQIQRTALAASIRVYILPADVERARLELDRTHPTPRKHLIQLMRLLDCSPKSWDGRERFVDGRVPSCTYRLDSLEDESLFYIFNTLPSPSVQHLRVSCPDSGRCIQDVLNSHILHGLYTTLYPYQKRTIATMIRREVEPARSLDPRLQPLRGPTGTLFYYDGETGDLFQDKREYEEACGGILGESMGLGKTLICLALVLATKGHWPSVPPEYSIDRHPVRSKVGSLMRMAAAATAQARVPWRSFFQDLSDAGESHDNCLTALKENNPFYIIPAPIPRRSRRPSVAPPGKTIKLCPATLIIVPQNLLSQWREQIESHLSENALQVLYLDTLDKVGIQSADELLPYDIILMSRKRLEQEISPGESLAFASAADDPVDYHSPLRDLHFLRVIMDEGHEFASYGSRNKAWWSLQQLHVDRKWIVSGTPASGLIGVEVETATDETSGGQQVSSPDQINSSALERRRKECAFAQERKDLEKLGGIVVGFLKLRPWANSKEEDPASWSTYILPYEDSRRKPRSLRNLLQSLVVRHRIEDFQADLQLPPLHNRVIRLQPSWYDKLSINLFILTLVANAVTSERVDEDYMFHAKNRHTLGQLITNLRSSGFYWTSFTPEGVSKTIKISRTYLEEHSLPGSTCSEADRSLLEQAISIGEVILNSEAWKAFACVHEMGCFVIDLPQESRQTWSLVRRQREDEPLLTGATQLNKAQQWVDSHLYMDDLSKDLAQLGSSTIHKMWEEGQRSAIEDHDERVSGTSADKPSTPAKKRKATGLTGTPKVTEKQTVSRAKSSFGPPKTKHVARDVAKPSQDMDTCGSGAPPILKSALKSSSNSKFASALSESSAMATPKLIGTASTKLSYLLDRVMALHQDEKILIFYEGDHIAYYLAQALDLVSVRYLIYTQTLSQIRQSAYISTFNKTSTFRVLLMNVHQAAHGLHIANASRVFFVNPVWQPNVEAQAIKRAHRIGQTRPVYVETLVLKDTLEDQMLQRRKNMTAQEHHKAEKSLLDDDRMSDLIKDARFLAFSEDEIHHVEHQIARLSLPQQIFGRSDRPTGDADDPDADLIFPVKVQSPSNKKDAKRKGASTAAPDLMASPSPRKKSSMSVVSVRNRSPPSSPPPPLSRLQLASPVQTPLRHRSQAPPQPTDPSSSQSQSASIRDAGFQAPTEPSSRVDTSDSLGTATLHSPFSDSRRSIPAGQPESDPPTETASRRRRVVGFAMDVNGDDDVNNHNVDGGTSFPSALNTPEPPSRAGLPARSLFGGGGGS